MRERARRVDRLVDARGLATAEALRADGIRAQRTDRATGVVDEVHADGVAVDKGALSLDPSGLRAHADRVTGDVAATRETARGERVEAGGRIDVVDADVERDAHGVRTAFGEVRGDQLFFKDPARKIDVVLDFFQLGDRRGARATVGMRNETGVRGAEHAIVDADIKVVKLGSGSAQVGNHVGEIDDVGGSIIVRSFDPSDLARLGSSVAIRNVHGKKLIWDELSSQALVDGADVESLKADTLWLRGLGGGRVAAGTQGLELGEGSLDIKQGGARAKGLGVEDAGAVFEVGQDTKLVAAWAEGVDLARTDVWMQITDDEERARREQAWKNKDWVDGEVARIDEARRDYVLHGRNALDMLVRDATAQTGDAWKESVSEPQVDPQKVVAGDPEKRVATDALDHVNGHVSVRISALYAVDGRAGDAQVDIPVVDGKVKVSDVRMRLGGLGLRLGKADVAILDMFDDGIADVELIEGGYIPMQKFVAIMNEQNGSQARHATKDASVDTDTGPGGIMRQLEVTAHVSDIRGKVAVGTKTEVDVTRGEVSADGSASRMQVGVHDVGVPKARHEDVELHGGHVGSLEIVARDLGDPDKFVSATLKGGRVDKVTKGRQAVVDAGRDAARSERGERGRKEGSR